MLNNTSHRIAVIGAGPAGAAAAVSAASMGLGVDWYDRETRQGGKLNQYHQLFPDRLSAQDVLAEMSLQADSLKIKRHFGVAVDRIETDDSQLILLSGDQIVGGVESVILATGFDFFDARIKEEFGYGIYDHVITSPDLEQRLRTDPESLHTDGQEPAAIAFVHCVGSRDQQVGISYCSKLCCITGIKQAIEVRELFPSCRVTNFYIDIRAFGTGYEELYREAQEHGKVRFIRGRVSEASENQQKRIVLKAEDTLLARPLKLTVDWVVLLVGMVPACNRIKIDDQGGTDPETGFYLPANVLSGTRMTGQKGIFIAGACGGPMSIPESIASGRSAAVEAWQYLNSK